MSHALKDSATLVRTRAKMLAACRQFFSDRDVVEVDTPLMSRTAPVDLHLEPVVAQCIGAPAYLHTSPEYAMKKLLANGSGDIYQLAHVFRDGEMGRLHRPEFTMIEWYRLGFSLQELIEETCQLVRLFVGDHPIEMLSYREAFQKYCNIDPLIGHDDDHLNHLLGVEVEPNLGRNGITVLHSYPASQAALAQITEVDGRNVAERFEIYYKGIELANGYHELANSNEQRERLNKATHERKVAEKETLPIDHQFVDCLDQLPDCCGVAAGFDRLLMLKLGTNQLSDVLPADF